MAILTMAGYQAAVVDEMCDKVAVHTSASGAAAEMAMLRYLRLLPAAERAALRHSWRLEPL